MVFTAMTMNIGTTTGLDHDADTEDGYTSAEAEIADAAYENSLSWNPAEQALTAFLALHQPDVATFQEGFYDGWCEDIDIDTGLDFVCRDFDPDGPLQIERVAGAGYQAVCAPGQPDNCAIVHEDFGRFVGCDQDVCLEGLEGQSPPSGCSRGARIGAVTIAIVGGGELRLVNLHGTSGFSSADMDCRVEQVEQVFVDAGDGEPAARGSHALVMGDLNTDPWLAAESDPSAARWNDFVGEGRDFTYLSSSDEDGEPTYAGLFRIDHVVGNGVSGSCVVPGETEGVAAVLDTVYWDHRPVLCEASLP